MQALTPAELELLLKAAKGRSIRDWAMLLVTYRHGMRASEACTLKLNDVDLRVLTVSIKRLKGSLHTVQALFPHPGKPILDEVSALRQWMRLRPDDGSDYVFVSQKGGRLHRSQLFRIYKQCAVDAGLPPSKRHVHCLKHTLGTHLAQANLNAVLIKQQLGHRAISSTLVYTDVNDAQAGVATQSALMATF